MHATSQGGAIIEAASVIGGKKIVKQPPANLGVGRLHFIDNLRWVMIIQVLMLHLAITYGPDGRWYYLENAGTERLGPLTRMLFYFCCESTHAFRMGMLFFIAGFFVPRAYDRKGVGRFLLDRLKRLGLPALVFMLLIQPVNIMLLRHYLNGDPASVIREYPHYIFSLKFLSGSGPLWFAVALLFFSVGYSGVRAVAERLAGRGAIKADAPPPFTHGAIAKLILWVTAATFMVRLVQPYGSTVMNMQLCFFAKYIALFMLGVLAYRRDLITRLPRLLAMRWFMAAIVIGGPWLLALEFLYLKNPAVFCGGWHWQAACYALWETFFCVGICLGLLVLFRDHCNWHGRLASYLSRNSFGVYVIHAPLMVWLTLSARHILCHPLLKFGVACVIFIPLCFAVSGLLRKIPLCNWLLS